MWTFADGLMEELARRAQEKRGGAFVVAIDGRCASGKTPFAEYAEKRVACTVLHMDDFFLRPEQRTRERLQMPGGNVDYERFSSEVLAPLKEGAEALSYRAFDCHTMTLLPPRTIRLKPFMLVEGLYGSQPCNDGSFPVADSVEGAAEERPCNPGSFHVADLAEGMFEERPYNDGSFPALVLVEGSYSCHPAFWDAYDYRVFLTVSEEEQRRRTVERNGSEGSKAFFEHWIPMEEKYFAAFSIPKRCDACFDTSS